MMISKRILGMLALSVAFSLAATKPSQGCFPRKKIIVNSFELGQARTEHLARHASKLEKLPIDGVVVSFYLKDHRYKPGGHRFMTARVNWKKEWFAEEIKNLRTLSAGRLKSNFLGTLWSPRRYLSWTDEAAWNRIIHNIGVMAWMAKAGGCEGLMFDVEDYTLKRQFFHRSRHGSYEHSAALARKRGAQVMTSIAREYPDVVILTTMLFCESNMLHHGRDVTANARLRGDLWVPFVNGMLDVIPKGAKLVEGNEHSYWMNASNDDYMRSYWDMKSSFLRLAYPENQDTYRTQVSAGFAFYPDAYTKPVQRKELTASDSVQRFRLNLGEALRYTDEYVWFWGEQFQFLKDWDAAGNQAVRAHSMIRPSSWDDELPGFYRVMEVLRDLPGSGERALKEGKAVNLMLNPTCVEHPDMKGNFDGKTYDWAQGYLPRGWNFWPDKLLSTISLDKTCGLGDSSSLKVCGAKSACVITVVPVKEGHFYGIEGFAKGRGRTSLTVRWQKPKGWLKEWAGSYDEILQFASEGGNAGWRRAFGAIQAPYGAAKMVLLVNVAQDPQETLWFDSFNVFEIK